MSNFVEIKDKDGVTLGQLPVSKEGGRLRNIVYITESGNYEKPAWLKFVRVRGIGGGGQSGGTPSTGETSQGIGGGGASGSYFEKKIDASALAASETVTIGAGGTGAAAGANGSDGGATSFGAHATAPGGRGGYARAAIANTASGTVPGGYSAVATGGDINIASTPGTKMVLITGTFVAHAASAASYLSGSVMAASNNVVTGDFPGGGGAPMYVSMSQAGMAGSAGAPGICIIEEYE